MGERVTYVLIGALEADLPPCPNPNGWAEWVYTHPAFQTGRPGVYLEGARFRRSYEARPALIGFVLSTLEYGEVWIEGGPETARGAWDKFRELAAAEGITLPPGRRLMSNDE